MKAGMLEDAMLITMWLYDLLIVLFQFVHFESSLQNLFLEHYFEIVHTFSVECEPLYFKSLLIFVINFYI